MHMGLNAPPHVRCGTLFSRILCGERQLRGPGPGWACLRGKGFQGWALQVLQSSHVNELSQTEMAFTTATERGTFDV